MIQDLPETKRKIIFWAVIIIISLGLLSKFVQITQERLRQVKGEKVKEELGIPYLQNQLEELPKIEMPKIDENLLKQFEELLKQTEGQSAQEQTAE